MRRNVLSIVVFFLINNTKMCREEGKKSPQIQSQNKPEFMSSGNRAVAWAPMGWGAIGD